MLMCFVVCCFEWSCFVAMLDLCALCCNECADVYLLLCWVVQLCYVMLCYALVCVVLCCF